MSLSPELLGAIAQTHLLTDGCDYVYLRFPLSQAGAVKLLLMAEESTFFCAMCDKNEFSLMVKQESWEIASRTQRAEAVSPVYRCITFDIILDFNLVGYLAAMAQVLASQKIAILAFSAFSRDHIFVQQPDFLCAWDALHAYIGHCKANTGAKLFSGLVNTS
ncbi:MAG: ACT domain-containing protein [Anaerolineales bacterium]|nr:MAG: ACT domain-containing protein [Anaerolineales bacterium]